MTEDEIIGWHHRLSGHEFEKTLGHSEGQGGLECCSTWGLKELDMTQQPNNNNLASENIKKKSDQIKELQIKHEVKYSNIIPKSGLIIIFENI